MSRAMAYKANDEEKYLQMLTFFAFDHSAMIKLKSFVDAYFGDEA